ncbi:hypothetical protein BpHYR1_015540 [Brachionus plicatilis]|uniref:Uncharacterized protein n=1 Tax=Brachionus plicatilis TaxID=10195 RepID=A0A3M7SP23_BRAPC|nr:hypothetical protein BpHYR1_015540 [Brachionus plicatilis]
MFCLFDHDHELQVVAQNFSQGLINFCGENFLAEHTLSFKAKHYSIK